MNSKFMFSSARFSISVTKFLLMVNFENMYEVIRLICKQSVTGCCRNSASTHTLDVSEIRQPFIHWVLQKFSDLIYRLSQKFCDHSCTGCRRNSATTHAVSVAEILLLLMHWVWQKFCNYSYTGCRRNSATQFQSFEQF